MPKILSQSGVSLADTYDIEGSIVGVENLETQDVNLFDEMGGRVFSERLQSFFIRPATGDIAQNILFTDITAGGIPDSPNRVLGICVIATADRIDHVQVSLFAPQTEQDLVIFAWNTATDVTVPILYEDEGVVTTMFLLSPAYQIIVPAMILRVGVSKAMMEIKMRGLTTGFGAGTVECFAVVHIARANEGNPAAGAPSSHGLPLPGW